MKKRMIAAVLICAAVFALAGCSSGVPAANPPAVGDSTASAFAPTEAPDASAAVSGSSEYVNAAEKNVDMDDLIKQLNARFVLGDMRAVTDPERYYAIKADDLDQFAAQVSTDSKQSDEIVICKAVSADAVTRVENSLNRRLDALYHTAESYSKDDLDRLQSCHVTVIGSYVWLIIAPNAHEIEQFIESQLR